VYIDVFAGVAAGNVAIPWFPVGAGAGAGVVGVAGAAGNPAIPLFAFIPCILLAIDPGILLAIDPLILLAIDPRACG
jgi:hypothetical protein